jgi:cytochrome oxidase Cu insertion factor (SCO1/SenC/PrrC family)
MYIMQPLCLCFILLFQFGYSQTNVKKGGKAIVEAIIPVDYSKDSVGLTLESTSVGVYPKLGHIKKNIQVRKNLVKWIYSLDEPYTIDGSSVLTVPKLLPFLIEPGDSIRVGYLKNQPVFSGRGAVKFQLAHVIEEIKDSLESTPEYKNLSSKYSSPTSVEDFMAWNTYLNKKMKLVMPVLEGTKSKLSEFAYLTFKIYLVEAIEKRRRWKFNSLRRAKEPGQFNHYGLSNKNLCEIYDSVFNKPSVKWLRYQQPFYARSFAWDMLHLDTYREKGRFFKTNVSDTAILGADPADSFILLYNLAKKKYKGVLREELMAFTFWFAGGVIHEVGFTPKVEALLMEYYAQPGYPKYKRAVKEYEMERRAKWNRIYAQEFQLSNAKGNLVTTQQFKGKIKVFDFWFTGCRGCIEMAPALRKVEEALAKDTNIVFLSVSIDKNREQWIKSIGQKRFTTGGGVQLYTSGKGKDHEMIKKFFVESYPTLEIIDPSGLFIKFDKRKVDPRIDSGRTMIAFLQKQLATLKDGPYVFYENEKATAFSIDGDKLDKKTFTKASSSVLKVQTDENKIFNVSLMPSLNIQPATYTKQEKLFVLSDIEGNFDAFRKLLQKNRIVDENLDWTFGNGHLVFAGDMFDRGRQVTECLWLIYSLEEKAKAAGGYVHFVLGNHEIMNLQGQDSYVEAKYKDNAALMGKTLVQLYNEDSELGRWLRTKNIVEKIGDILFLHGGISSKINALPITVSEINQLARPNYATYKKDYGDDRTNSIMSSSTGPFWYRTYYDDKKDMPQIIDSTLQKFDVKHIVTGHTIVADTISVHYGGKVINTDVHHAEGKSEALLIEGDKFYRVNGEGKKVLLFTDDKRKASGK